MTTKANTYVGRIVSVPNGDGLGFVGIGSLTKSDGSYHDLKTIHDIFIHQDDCAVTLRPGLEISFEIVPDKKRGEGYMRAMGAMQVVTCELLPASEPAVPGFNALMPLGGVPNRSLKLHRLPVHSKMKEVSEELVAKVIANRPAPEIPRESGAVPNPEEVLRRFLLHLYPALELFGTDFEVLNADDTELDKQVDEAVKTQRDLGMTSQADMTKQEIEAFKKTRTTFRFLHENGLVRQDAILPMRYLPDLFMAVPVWYFFIDNQEKKVDSERDWNSNDPEVNSTVRYFCDLFPNQRWFDTFQMFNRRIRGLSQYKGDIIPPHVTRRMKEATALFDYVAIMTPYHDVAGRDWQDLKWLRSIDPYLVGFKKGIPYFFVLGRFSDSGTFPLHNELVADTIAFLKANSEKLSGFNAVRQAYWYQGTSEKDMWDRDSHTGTLGTHLRSFAKDLLGAFDRGTLFDWIRWETD